MSADNFKYKSVHEYMDALFNGRTPSDLEIKQAKKAYRRLYLRAYHLKYIKENVQITFRISKSDFNRIKKMALEQNMKVSHYAKQLLLGSNPKVHPKIKISLLELRDMLEEAQLTGSELDIGPVLSTLDEMLETLQ